MKHTLSVLVENSPGVLTRVAGLFARRGYNIDSLSVGKTDNDKYSYMTIVVNGDEEIIEQVCKQLHKLIEVIKLVNVTEKNHIEREMIFIKVNSDTSTRGEILNLLQVFRGKVVDIAKDSMIVEVTGDSRKVDAIVSALNSYGIKEVVRTGIMAMTRGGK